MPELPEVETVVRTLKQLVVGKTIERVDVLLPRIVRRPDPLLFCSLLAGHTFRDITRRGKFIRFEMDQLVLVSHLRMEGRYGLFRSDDVTEKHTHVVFRFTDGTELRYKDVRQFGTMDLFEAGAELEHPPLCNLGVEPLDAAFTDEVFRQTIGRRTTKIKPLLLNQEYIVGLGNIYVDEALFAAGIHPERTADSLTSAEMKRLYSAVVSTLRHAVEMGGSSVKSYVNGQGEMGMFQQELQVYGRKSQPCMRCGQPVMRLVVGGRGTHICTKCQPMRKQSRKSAKTAILSQQ